MSKFYPFKRRGLMIVLSSPSGAGKTTVARHILSHEKEISVSVSVTTRPQRSSEENGKDYHFVSPEDFSRMVADNHFLEHATVYGHAYGTPKGIIQDRLNQGIDVLFDVDWQGTHSLKENAPEDVVSIFLMPPSLSILEARLRGRGQDSEETIVRRMKQAESELSHWTEYDYVLVNDDLQTSVEAVRSIIRSERLKGGRQILGHKTL